MSKWKVTKTVVVGKATPSNGSTTPTSKAIPVVPQEFELDWVCHCGQWHTVTFTTLPHTVMCALCDCLAELYWGADNRMVFTRWDPHDLRVGVGVALRRKCKPSWPRPGTWIWDPTEPEESKGRQDHATPPQADLTPEPPMKIVVGYRDSARWSSQDEELKKLEARLSKLRASELEQAAATDKAAKAKDVASRVFSGLSISAMPMTLAAYLGGLISPGVLVGTLATVLVVGCVGTYVTRCKFTDEDDDGKG